MKKRNKWLSVVCCIGALLIPAIANGAAVTEKKELINVKEACTHPKTVYVENGISYAYRSSEEHTKSYIYLRYCAVCQEQLRDYYIQEYESHNFTTQTDLGHSGVKHTWRTSCVCGYSITDTRVCSGPPCLMPFKDINMEEDK